VEYEGVQYVATCGKQQARITADQVRDLVTKFYDAGYFSLRDSYRATVTDNPTTYTSIVIEGRAKHIEDYVSGPPELKRIEEAIDEAAGAEKWIDGEHGRRSSWCDR